MSSVDVVILAGGQGSRFWPLSRQQRPKQFLSISPSGESLIEATARRVQPLAARGALWVVTNEKQETITRECLPGARIVTEPVGRNTAASIGLAALHVRRRSGDAVMVVLPADHSVKDEEKFLATLESAVSIAAADSQLVTIGIAPTNPNTGYGYIKRGESLGSDLFTVARFFEKPNFDRAKSYLESGEYLWNSGMFVWKVSTILRALELHLPELYQGLVAIDGAIGTPNEGEVMRELFPTLESISIDIGVLEHARNCVVVVGEPFGWTDVGAWDAWADHFTKDAKGNLVKGDTLLIDSKGCVVYSEKRLVAVVGGTDLIVVDSGDALLVCPREKVQEVREVVKQLTQQKRFDLV